jgi:hypothetical protein
MKTGIGHQYKKDERVIDACKKSLMEGFMHLGLDIDNPDINLLRFDIQSLVNRCVELSYSAREAQKQDN